MKTTLVSAMLIGMALTLGPAMSLMANDPAPAAAPAPAASPAFKAPLLITDVGQGNTGKLVEVMLNRSKAVELKLDNTAKAEALEGVGTLVIGVGASTKGLGAAGLDVNTELERAKALIAAAKAKGIPIMGVHIGGEARRGELSDSFNRLVAESADTMVVWSGSDADGFFKKIAEEKGTKLEVVDGKPKAGEKILELLGVAKPAAAAAPAAPSAS